MIDSLYCQTHDIDWFCIINGKPIHVASNGGELPLCFNKQMIFTQRQYVLDLPDIEGNEVSVIESKYLNDTISEKYQYWSRIRENEEVAQDFMAIFGEFNSRKLYLRSFIQMAKKGFYSFDRIDNHEGDSGFYQMLLRPSFQFRPNDRIPFFIPDVSVREDLFLNIENPLHLVNLINENYR